MINAFTVDLEPWMCFYDNMPLSKRLDYGNLVKTTMQLLNILEDYDTTATFFTLGVVYDWFPNLLDEIRSRGHEIAFHGYSHRELEGTVLRDEIEKSRRFICRYNISGFRAPQMKITRQDINFLISANFFYDSSIYGSLDLSSTSQNMMEIPVSTYPARKIKMTFPRTLKDALKNLEVPVGSGLFIGLFSSKLLNCIIRKINREGQPFVLFIHPWQLSSLPEVRSVLQLITSLKFLYTMKISREKLKSLLQKNTFVSVKKALKEWDGY